MNRAVHSTCTPSLWLPRTDRVDAARGALCREDLGQDERVGPERRVVAEALRCGTKEMKCRWTRQRGLDYLFDAAHMKSAPTEYSMPGGDPTRPKERWGMSAERTGGYTVSL